MNYSILTVSNGYVLLVDGIALRTRDTMEQLNSVIYDLLLSGFLHSQV